MAALPGGGQAAAASDKAAGAPQRVMLQASSGGGAAVAPGPTLIQPGMEPNTLCAALPVFDLGVFLAAPDSPEAARLCAALAECLKASSTLVVRDPRVDAGDSERFLSLMERYFGQAEGAKRADVRADLAYQVGATPEGVEKPRCLRDPSILAAIEGLPADSRPTVPTEADVKWRFFWRLGQRPAETRFPELNAAPVVPAAFPEWRAVMDGWGGKMLGAVATVAGMAARGFGLEADAFTSRMQHAPHLLAPTGSDLGKHGKLGTVYAGFHYDLNFLTIHGRSRYPGLYAWLADGRRIPVRIPEGCLLLQAGKQMEWLTGGAVKAGYHEVICTEETLAAAERARADGRPTWRVSSTVFSQIASDAVLQPLGPFAAAPAQQQRRVMAAAAPVAGGVDTTLNPRVASLKPSKTMALTDLATRLKEEGADIIGLAAGEPDFDTPAPIIEAGIEALRQGYTRYTPNTGTSALRKAICEKLQQENGLAYSPEEIVVSNGAKQCIWQALLATCSEDDEVIIPAPYWVSYPEMARMAGATPVIVDATPEEGFKLTPDNLRAALTPRSRLLILCTPSNPTGAVYTKEELEALAAVVAEHPRLLVLSDEIYEYIVYAPAQHHSFGTLPGMFERTLTVNGFSKAYAMTGWRLGYLAAPRHFAKAAAVIQSQSTSGASSIAQHAAVTALGMGPGGGPLVQEMIIAFEQRRDFVTQRLQQIEGVRLAAPQGAFYVMPEVSDFCGAGVEARGFGPVPDVDTLCRYLIEKANVALVPGDAFGSPTCLRISYAASMETLGKALDRIAAALAADNFTRA